MPELTTRFGPFVAGTFTLALAFGALGTLALAIWNRRASMRTGNIADACLGALIGAAVGGRLTHAALNWDYFGLHRDEIVRLSAGGLDWHGAVIGGLIGLALAARWRRLSISGILDALTPALPLLAVTGWYGCWAAACGYGAEVDTLARYPAWMVAEMPDVYGIAAPRYDVQLFGVVLGALTLAFALALMALPRLRGARFWLTLALLSAEMFALGFVRGDFAQTLGGLRIDQWLDGGMIVLSVVVVVAEWIKGKTGLIHQAPTPNSV